jgi:hypothetical protein
MSAAVDLIELTRSDVDGGLIDWKQIASKSVFVDEPANLATQRLARKIGNENASAKYCAGSTTGSANTDSFSERQSPLTVGSDVADGP